MMADNKANNTQEEFDMNIFMGPRDRTTELTENEELEVLEAYQSAEEFLDMRVEDEDFFFDTEE